MTTAPAPTRRTVAASREPLRRTAIALLALCAAACAGTLSPGEDTPSLRQVTGSPGETSLSRGEDARCPLATPLAPGVYWLAGAGGTPSRANAGKVVNRAFLVGDSGVALIDPGPTRQAGAELACTLRRHAVPAVAAIVNTHPHPENVLAAVAFAGAAVYASAPAAAAMRQRCDACRERLGEQIGAALLADTPAQLPTHAVTAAQAVSLAGRRVELIPLGEAHSPGDLAVLDIESGIVFGGDVLNADTLPDLRDGNVQAWRAALRLLLARRDIRLVVPGRGEPFSAERLARPLAYLDALWDFARARVEAPDGFVPPAALPEEIAAFAGDPLQHALNLQHALREAEQAWWDQEHEK